MKVFKVLLLAGAGIAISAVVLSNPSDMALKFWLPLMWAVFAACAWRVLKTSN